MDMWQIVVPYHWNDGRKIPMQHHNAWDTKVCALTNGLMLRGTTKGKWGLKKEKVILVDVACDAATISQIGLMTKEHYEQEAVLYYRIGSTAVVI